MCRSAGLSVYPPATDRLFHGVTVPAAFRNAPLFSPASATLREVFQLDRAAELTALEPTFARCGNTKITK